MPLLQYTPACEIELTVGKPKGDRNGDRNGFFWILATNGFIKAKFTSGLCLAKGG